jgi:hypothetical protein
MAAKISTKYPHIYKSQGLVTQHTSEPSKPTCRRFKKFHLQKCISVMLLPPIAVFAVRRCLYAFPPHYITFEMLCCLYGFNLIFLVLGVRGQSQANVYSKQIMTGTISFQVLRELRFSPVSFMPPTLHIHSFIYSFINGDL